MEVLWVLERMKAKEQPLEIIDSEDSFCTEMHSGQTFESLSNVYTEYACEVQADYTGIGCKGYFEIIMGKIIELQITM